MVGDDLGGSAGAIAATTPDDQGAQMEYRKMGRTGLKVSAICLGTMTLGKQVDEPTSIGIIERALDLGINFVDTADMYVNGVTEQIVAKAIKGKRDSVVLASKGGHIRKLAAKYGEYRDLGPIDLARPKHFRPWEAGEGTGPNDMGLSRKHLMQALEGSLRRLGTDYLDIYYAHMPDYATPLDETLRAMDDMVRHGKVRYLGCSNFRAFQLGKALAVSERLNLVRWDVIQPPLNLLARDVEYELLPLCREEGVGVCSFSPMAAGLLSGKYDREKPPIEGARYSLGHLGYTYNKPYWNDANFAAIEQLKKLAAGVGTSMSRFALAWVLANPVVTAIVNGATSAAQLEDNVAATEIKLPKDVLDACDDIWRTLRAPTVFYGR
jgi:aryl-alcohol dehydrogenase (NADP+)